MSERASSRRTVLRLTGAAATAGLTALAGCSGGGGGDGGGGDGGGGDGGGSGSVAKTFAFGGKVGGWQGKSPSGIKGKTNPTLTLTAGKQYEFTWTNGDGITHDFQILDGDGNVLKETNDVSSKGKSASVTVTAKKKMQSYRCSFHPSSMKGSLTVE